MRTRCGPNAHEPVNPDGAALRESARTGRWLGQTTSEPPRGIEPVTYALREPLPASTLALTSHFTCTVGISSQPQPPQTTPVRSTNGSTPTSPRQAGVVATTTALGCRRIDTPASR